MKLIILTLAVSVLAGCGERIENLLTKPAVVTQGMNAAPVGQGTPQVAVPPAAASRGTGLVRIPEPSVADVVGPRRAEQGRQVGNGSAARRSEATSAETFDVITGNAATMQSLDVYFNGESK